ncbi:MAG: Nif3-like dinuclear metal center hexameric protein [Nitrospina sp.]|jgi:dinuclear metal center YbgI/SA1388 family protein|nr:Nif3-like dinuclear metal center hexameric protein [Nitrospina sp.]MBT5631894.1 Nif3-like dinuclear metal center hexameric protein [Nitrospina sp.]
MDILQLSHYLDNLLDIPSIDDAPNALNGLQVQNTGEIKKIGLAVDLCQATIELAIEKNCQMMFVHHGIFWGGLQPLRGSFYEKISSMINANLGLYSAHIPLDLHPVFGNNRALADLIGLNNLEPFGEYGGIKIGFKGTIVKKSAEGLAQELAEKLGSSVKVIGEGEIETVGLVTGGAADIIQQASREGLDAYITGEGANHHYHEAIENHCIMIFAGHYATETGGVKSVGGHLEQKFGVTTEFLDYPTGL